MRTLLPLLVALGSVAQAQDWIIDTELTAAQLEQRAIDQESAGYWPTSITVREDRRFAVVWERETAGIDWFVSVEKTATEMATLGSTFAVSWRQVSIDFSGDYGDELYTTVWLKDATTFGDWKGFARIAPQDLRARVESQRDAGRELYFLASGGYRDPRFHALFRATTTASSSQKLKDETACVDWLDDQTGAGRLVLSTTSYVKAPLTSGPIGKHLFDQPGERRFAGVSVPGSTAVDTSFGLLREEVQPMLRWMMARNFVPVSVDSWVDGEVVRYNVSWQETANAYQFIATGPSAPSLAGLDTAMETYMTTGDVPHAVLAVTKNGELKHLRGYNYTRTGSVAAQPLSPARVASMSKPMTALGVMKLVQVGLIGLDQEVSTIIDLSDFNLPGNVGSQTMTVRQLLTHTAGIGSASIVNNEETWATALGRPLPSDRQMWIDYMATQDFENTPYQEYSYANFGYALLGEIIEEVSGQSYEMFIKANVFTPAGATRVRIGGTLLSEQETNELPYVFTNTVYDTSVMGDGATVPYVYGGFNMPTGDALGGWSLTAEAYARVLVALDDITSSPLLNQATIQTMWSVDANIWPVQNDAMCMGWRRLQSTSEFYHGGDLRGTHAAMMKRNDGVNFVVILGTSDPDIGSLRTTVDAAIDGILAWPAIDLWDTIASLSSYGEGTGGTSGVPSLSLADGGTSVMGASVELELTSLPESATSVVLVQGYESVARDLSLLGFPGRTIYPRGGSARVVPAAGGRATVRFDIPDDPTLVGSTLHLQCVALDPELPGRLVTSRGAALVIGE